MIDESACLSVHHNWHTFYAQQQETFMLYVFIGKRCFITIYRQKCTYHDT